MNAASRCKVKIVGATGYSGGELISLLLNHPRVEITAITASSVTGPEPIHTFWPALRGMVPVPVTKEVPGEGGAEVVFVCTPHGAAMEIVPAYHQTGCVTIDLSADFRFNDPAERTGWYEGEHTAPGLCAEAVYGLPELFRGKVRGANLIANPGCYPTGAILSLYPGLKSGALKHEGVHISAASGVTGAGKKPKQNLHHPELDQNFYAYRIGKHQHLPEIVSVLRRAVEKPVSLSFVPHLLPLQRGIFYTIFAAKAKEISLKDLWALYDEAYRGEPFVRLYPLGETPTLHAVRGSNFVDISLHQDAVTGEVIFASAEDNLVKGAAGQAVQNMNVRMGFPETEGLLPIAMQREPDCVCS
ncbi:MAG: N-acetyl-gamma-glutamyl-phosphate reductase [bacterium]|nr:N-acetyl-gamma-glutamyl-phosphate reductase [bacterium]